MRERPLYLWRIFVTGTCFFLFGLAGLVLGLLVFPAMMILPGGPERRRSRMRAVVQRSFRLFVTVMSGLRGIRYDFSGTERLGRPGQLIIANHPTLVDVVMIIAFTPAPACVVKAALFANPFTRRVVRAAGYIRNAPTDEMIERAIAALQARDTLVMFPEGTRTSPGQPLVFHRGAASVAVRAATVLTPIFIKVDQPLLHKSLPWYKVPARVPRFSIRVGEDINLEPFRSLPPPLASRKLNTSLLEVYERELAVVDGYNGRTDSQRVDSAESVGEHANER